MTARTKVTKNYTEEAGEYLMGTHAPGFVVQLYDMVNNSPPEMISWSISGDSFVINADVKQVENELLPQYFRHGRFPSFVRQLNLYSFRKMNQERTSWVYKHDKFHRDRPEDLHLVRRVSGVDGRKNRINKLPTSALIENNENNDLEMSVEITPVNLGKKRFASTGSQVVEKKRVFGADITNLATHGDKPTTPLFVRIIPIYSSAKAVETKKNRGQAMSVSLCKLAKTNIATPLISYKKSNQYLVGDLLTYDDDIKVGNDFEAFDTPLKAIGAPSNPPSREINKSKPLDLFVPDFSADSLQRIVMSVAWPRPGQQNGDLPSASLACLVLEGFTGKESLLSKMKHFLQRFPTIAEEFYFYEIALRDTAVYSIEDGNVQFHHTVYTTPYSDMMHDFAAFVANRFLDLPELEDSFSSEDDLAIFCKALIDWKVAVQSLF